MDFQDKEDFICVPVNNLDHDTVHFKVDDEDFKMRSQVMGFDSDRDSERNVKNSLSQSSIMKSL